MESSATRTDYRERLRTMLESCIERGEITLASGKKTDFYFDGRLVSYDFLEDYTLDGGFRFNWEYKKLDYELLPTNDLPAEFETPSPRKPRRVLPPPGSGLCDR